MLENVRHIGKKEKAQKKIENKFTKIWKT